MTADARRAANFGLAAADFEALTGHPLPGSEEDPPVEGRRR